MPQDTAELISSAASKETALRNEVRSRGERAEGSTRKRATPRAASSNNSSKSCSVERSELKEVLLFAGSLPIHVVNQLQSSSASCHLTVCPIVSQPQCRSRVLLLYFSFSLPLSLFLRTHTIICSTTLLPGNDNDGALMN
jgi:hypothetical protein